jgi:hypothetical protein
MAPDRSEHEYQVAAWWTSGVPSFFCATLSRRLPRVLRRCNASAHLRIGPPRAIGIGTRLIPWRFPWPWSESSPSVARPLGLIPSLPAASRNIRQSPSACLLVGKPTNMPCGHILLLSFAYCSPVPLALGWFYSDIWAKKRKAVIRITIRPIILGGTPEKALLASESSHCWRELASCKEYKHR